MIGPRPDPNAIENRGVRPQPLGELHQLQRYRMVRVRRSQIRNAEYNPRYISEAAKKKLKLGLQKLGLLMPLVWNERTGNLVGGHQRLEILDKLAGPKADYEIEVATVDLTTTAEREANILLNNPEAMGEWDLAKLDSVLRTDGLRLEATGFDMGDIYQVLGDSPFAQDNALALSQLAEEQRKTTDAIDAVAAAMNSERDSSDFYVVAVFRDPAHRTEFLSALGLPENTYQDGRRLQELLVKRRATEDDDGIDFGPIEEVSRGTS